MIHWITVHHVLLYAIALCAIFAFWKGGWAERIGGLANAACAGAWIVAKASLSPDGLAIAELAIDCLLSFTFLGLAVCFASRWLGIAMLLQAAQFSLHAYYFVTERTADLLRATVNNVVSWGMVFCILAGVVATWVSNARAARRQRAAAA
jgi:hypothetical protein